MLDLVMDKVKTRSEDMEKLIAKYDQTNDTKGENHEKKNFKRIAGSSNGRNYVSWMRKFIKQQII